MPIDTPTQSWIGVKCRDAPKEHPRVPGMALSGRTGNDPHFRDSSQHM